MIVLVPVAEVGNPSQSGGQMLGGPPTFAGLLHKTAPITIVSYDRGRLARRTSWHRVRRWHYRRRRRSLKGQQGRTGWSSWHLSSDLCTRCSAGVSVLSHSLAQAAVT